MITHSDAETNVIFAMLQEARDEAIVKCGKMATQMEQISAELTAAKAEIDALKTPAMDRAERRSGIPAQIPFTADNPVGQERRVEPVVPAPAAE